MKVLFNGIGPDRNCILGERKYKDGDVDDVNDSEYKLVVDVLKIALPYNKEFSVKTKNLISSAHNKREEIARKVEKLNNE